MIRRIAIAAALALAVGDVAWAAPITAHYYPSPRYPGLVERLARQRLLENIAQRLQAFAIPAKALTLTLRDCGRPNAIFLGGSNEMRLCTELLSQLVELNQDMPTARARGLQGGGTLLFVAAHEYGHALIHQQRVPFLGREEDAADQIATMLVLQDKAFSPPALAGAIRFFHREGNGSLGDVHSLDGQRRINVACWAWGAKPSAFQELRELIPAGRRPHCRGEASRIVSTLSVLRSRR